MFYWILIQQELPKPTRKMGGFGLTVAHQQGQLCPTNVCPWLCTLEGHSWRPQPSWPSCVRQFLPPSTAPYRKSCNIGFKTHRTRGICSTEILATTEKGGGELLWYR